MAAGEVERSEGGARREEGGGCRFPLRAPEPPVTH